MKPTPKFKIVTPEGKVFQKGEKDE